MRKTSKEFASVNNFGYKITRRVFKRIFIMWFFTDEEKELQRVCTDFARNELAPFAEKHDTEESFNMDAFKKMGEIGVLGITASPDFGGAGMGCLAATVVMEEFGKACASSTLSFLAHSILAVNNIENNASKEQKEKYHIGCMGMSEPEYGSDAIGIQTKAENKGDHYLLNGTKMWITNAQYADIAYVYARTGKGRKDISTFLLEKEKGHFSFGKPIHKMGMRASPTGELVFEGCKIPMENRVGEENQSTYHMMKNLDIERITISGISLGIAQACLDQCVKYANERKQFGKTIGNYQMIQRMIAEMAAEVDMMRSFTYQVAYEYDQGNHGPVQAAKVKLAIPKLATKIALDAIQVHGGYGYSREFPVERMMRDNKLMEIGAGTNEIMILIIAKNLLSMTE
jgi:isovaleryl-CoA dehydrogenase